MMYSRLAVGSLVAGFFLSQRVSAEISVGQLSTYMSSRSCSAFVVGDRPTLYFQNGLYSAKVGTAQIGCPVWLDYETAGGLGRVYQRITVLVDDQSSTENVTCEARVRSMSGTLHYSGTLSSSSVGRSALIWGQTGTPPSGFPPFGWTTIVASNLYLWCRLPSGVGSDSGVIGYRVTEPFN